MNGRHIAGAVLSGSAVCLLTTVGWAQASLSWAAPGECPPGQDVGRRVAELLGYALDEHETVADFSAEVSASSDGLWHLNLRMSRDGQMAHRRIDGESCRAVADAAAVAIALALKPGSAGDQDGTSESEVAPEPETKPSPAPAAKPARKQPRRLPRTRETARRPRASEPSRLGGAARALVGADATTFGRVALQTELALALRLDERWRIEGYGLWLPEQRVFTRASTETNFQLLAGGARGCHEQWHGVLGWLGCVGAEVGQVSAAGRTLTRSQRGRATWGAPFLALVGFWTLTDHLALGVQAGAAFPLARHEFFVDGLGVVHRLPTVAPRLGLGLEVSLP